MGALKAGKRFICKNLFLKQSNLAYVTQNKKVWGSKLEFMYNLHQKAEGPCTGFCLS